MNRVLFKSILFLSTGLVLLLAISPVLSKEGWPYNHDNINMMSRTQVYAEHFLQGDLLPLWSWGDGYTLGSPMPAYYQKLFFITSGVIYLIIHSIKVSVVLAILIFMIIGACGMYRLASLLTSNKGILLVIPLAFILCNYSFTNWLVRGSVAEFSAMMIVPWLIYYCILLINSKKSSWLVVPIFFGLFLAHNAIALLSLPIILFSYIIYIILCHKSSRKPEFKRIGLQMLCIVILIVPFLLIQQKFNSDFSPSTKIIQNGFTPQNQMRPLRTYIADLNYSWFKDFRTYTNQIDYGITLIVLAAFVVYVFYALRLRRWFPWSWSTEYTQALVYVLPVLAFYLFLQTKYSIFLYDLLKPLELIQFPWRLLVFIIPLLLVVVIILFEKLSYRIGRPLFYPILFTWFLTFLIFSPALKDQQSEFYNDRAFSHVSEDSLIGFGMIQGGEYVPEYQKNNKPATQTDSFNFYLDFANSKLGTSTTSRNCILKEERKSLIESLNRKFYMNCSRNSSYLMPITFSSHLGVKVNNNIVQAERLHDDPRLLVNLKKGANIVELSAPTVSKLLKY